MKGSTKSSIRAFLSLSLSLMDTARTASGDGGDAVG